MPRFVEFVCHTALDLFSVFYLQSFGVSRSHSSNNILSSFKTESKKSPCTLATDLLKSIEYLLTSAFLPNTLTMLWISHIGFIFELVMHFIRFHYSFQILVLIIAVFHLENIYIWIYFTNSILLKYSLLLLIETYCVLLYFNFKSIQ